MPCRAARMGHAAPLHDMDNDVLLPVLAGLGLILLIVAGSVVLVLRPSDTPDRKS